jgi:Adenylate and Guanylate cyclase catalytic domain
MASFALECRKILQDVTRSLERELGPDTSDDMCLRIGLHSGPVTAGLLRGEKHRFQLFGDTVNIASRMESSGEENLIQVSESTATLLKEAGKGDWLLKRQGTTSREKTYWLERKNNNGRRLSVDASYFAFSGKSASSKKKNSLLWSATANLGTLDTTTPQTTESDAMDSTARLVDWNVDILLKLLRQVVSIWLRLKFNPYEVFDFLIFLGFCNFRLRIVCL